MFTETKRKREQGFYLPDAPPSSSDMNLQAPESRREMVDWMAKMAVMTTKANICVPNQLKHATVCHIYEHARHYSF